MTNIIRTTVYWTQDIRDKVERLAKRDRRSVSNYLSTLIESEYARVFGEAADDTEPELAAVA